jgi:thioredoxin 1
MRQKIQFLIVTGLIAFTFACSGQDTDTANTEINQKSDQDTSNSVKPKITFIELGSVNCIPCKMMQPVMKSIEEKYGKQVKVVFYDVWKPEQKRYAQEYNIRVIPTQVFLDKGGKEIFRHEGFFPEKEIDAFMEKQGLKPGKQI